jgi:hypothetical protein
MPAIGQVASLIGRPRDHVCDAQPDLVVTTRASVRLHRPVDRDVAYQPGPVGRRHDPLDATPGTLLVETRSIIAAVVLTRHPSSVGPLNFAAKIPVIMICNS